MRWTAAVPAVIALAAVSGCSGEEERTAAGVPERWYTAVAEAHDERPGVGSTALVENGGPCPLRDEVVLAGAEVSDVSGHGLVRLGGSVPAVLCSWYDGTPVEVTVARADDDAGYAGLVEATGAVQQRGNEQTEQEVRIGDRTFLVVRIHYPTNPAAGTDLAAHYFDEEQRGRVTLEVSGAHDLDGYDERAVADDLAAFLDG